MQQIPSRTLKIFVLVTLAAACAPIFVSEDPDNLSEMAAEITTKNGLKAMQAGQPTQPMVLFIHGTPGSWHAFKDYLVHPRLVSSLNLVAVDRPGFGRSADLALAPSLTRQSELIAGLFDLNLSGQPIVVVGHSLGGSIGLRVAVDHPDSVGALLSISAALSPELGKPRWYNRLAALPLVRYVVPADLKLANAEIMPLRDELNVLQHQLAKIRIPVTIIQGSEDPLVNPDNAAYAEAKLINAQLKVDRFPEEGHFIVWSHVDHVVDEILRLSKQH
ncbi:MAG: alpha/beta fold hydrolase [Pseudomonadales bacterium]|nr:alpha/beta fold hydrolase [Pseudomonadales bacterium]